MKRYLLQWVYGEEYEHEEYEEYFDTIQEVEDKINELVKDPYTHDDSFRCLEVVREIKITPVERITKFIVTS